MKTGANFSCRIYRHDVSTCNTIPFSQSVAGVHPVEEVLSLDMHTLVLSKAYYGDLQQYLVEKKRLTDLFCQIVEIVRAAHCQRIVLRDIRIDKFVFKDSSKTCLSLHYLDDAHCLDDSGLLTGMHCSPAYVCPEMLQSSCYKGRPPDLWSLGIILYTLLVGYYPFVANSLEALYFKVQNGCYKVPSHVSELGQSVISSLLAHDPDSRVPAWAILEHPWFKETKDEDFKAYQPIC